MRTYDDPYYLLKWLEASAQQRGYIMYQVLDKDGNVLATYSSKSECETYFRASFPDCEFDAAGSGDGSEIVVFDKGGNDVGSIKPPPKRIPRSTGAGRSRSGVVGSDPDGQRANDTVRGGADAGQSGGNVSDDDSPDAASRTGTN